MTNRDTGEVCVGTCDTRLQSELNALWDSVSSVLWSCLFLGKNVSLPHSTASMETPGFKIISVSLRL